ncbi:MAG: arylsulfatase [Thermoguttaceae bacterium]|nr:arylsulfatase [Thermoguttaceae bacterium]
MTTRRLLLTLAIASAAGLAANDARPAEQPTGKPHILMILADDLGWGDVGFHGGEIKTPNLDRLAFSGARLEQFNVQPVCSPTRAALMTGRYPMRHGLQVGVVRPWAQYGLPLEERTLPQALKEAGYATAICGKWHLGHFQPEYLPTRRGFDRQYGHYNGAIDYFTHQRDGGHDWHRDDKACYDQGYSTFLLADEAVRIIRQHNLAKPLFLYLAFNAVHAPHQVPPAYVEPYRHLDEPRRTYAGMVAAMDEAIGRVLAALEERRMRQRTLVVFSSDNGGPAPGRVTSNGRYRAGKGTLYEGGVRVAACAAWEGHIKPGTVVDQPLHIVDWYPTLLKLAGAPLDQKLPLDGRDAWPTITQGKPSPHDEIVLNAAPASGAILVGQWKLVIRGGLGTAEDQQAEAKPRGKRAKASEPIELFNLAVDPYEKENLAPKHPEKVQELRARYKRLAAQAVPPKAAPKPSGFRSPKVWGHGE